MKKINLPVQIARLLFFSLIGLLIFFIFYGIKELIIPISIAFLLSLFLNPFVYFFESLGIPRLLSVILTLIGLVIFIYIAIYLILPFLIEQVNKLYEVSKFIISKLPEVIEKLKEQYGNFLPENNDFIQLDFKWIMDMVLKPIRSIHIFKLIPNILTFLIITPILLFIFMLQGDEIYQYLMSLVPNRFFEMTLMITYNVRYGIVSYLRGLAIQIFILAIIMIPGLIIVGIPYGPALGAFAAFINIVPYIGPLLGVLPILLVSLISDISLTPFALLVFGLAQIIDNVFTQPVILARSVNVHPVIAILALITFQKWLGMIGMVIAIPLAGIIIMTIQTMYRSLKAFDII
ncbi:MAG: AI-2E family transporter [Leptospiraceae bacterium]|nr:MAG: AI-2E family transporter [Leptospiraceae bacterium]